MAQVSNHNASTSASEKALPAIAAAFLVTFDNRKGYTIAWQKSQEHVKLDGVVEFKSLPSGLHNVREDLVYFVHGDLAGVSAFLREDDSEAARNARMLAVGVLVPLEAGRMGKSFLFAQDLKKMARTMIEKPDDYEMLDRFWQNHKMTDAQQEDSPRESQSAAGYQKLRGLSISTLGSPGATPSLAPYHPALALPELLTVFGPLIFPLSRAALLRERILILGEAPVELMCNFVYNISVLAAISSSIAGFVPALGRASLRLKPLFNVGISDISTLESMHESWIACTTDDVLASKPQLFDLLVLLPNASSIQRVGNRTYPRLIRSTPELSRAFPRQGLRATQRDARRYAALRKALQAVPSGASPDTPIPDETASDAASTAESVFAAVDQREAVEPMPWSVIAYTSLIWWASAGDRRSGLMEAEELGNEQDDALLNESLAEESTTKEVALVAYFHKLSALVFSVLSNAIDAKTRNNQEQYHDSSDNDDEENTDNQAQLLPKDTDDDEPVEISEEDVRVMGLDIWSESDKRFISEMVHFWWKRDVIVRSGTIECCGVRIL